MKIYIPAELNILLYTKNTWTFLIFKNTKTAKSLYLKCPSNTQIIKKNQILTFISKRITISFLQFIKLVQVKINVLCKKEEKKQFYKKLILKGLGFKVLNIVQKQFIELKLGFSHFIKLTIPADLALYNNKNMIVVEGPKKDSVGNFANKIKHCRMPDSYKGKGIWYKRETKSLKEVKKA